jgi:capsule polysaccharide export protein KpsE/RkpR
VVGAYIEELDRTIKDVSTSAARRERMFLEQRLASEKKALDEAQQKFSQFASSNMALDIPEQTRVTVEAASRLEGELIANRAQLEVLQQTYTPENYRVKNLQTHVNELERELTRLNTGKSAKGRSEALNPYPAVKNLPVLGVQWSDLYRDAKIHETVFELLTQQYEMAGIQEAREIPVIKVLDPPSSPEFKRPSVWLILLISSVVSTLLAAIGILLRDKWAMWNAEDPRRVLLAKVYSGTRESISFWRSRNQEDERSYKSS